MFEVVWKMKLSCLRNIRACLVTAAMVCAATTATAVTINFDVDRDWTQDTNTYTSTDGSVSVDVDGIRIGTDGQIQDTNQFWTASFASPTGNGGLGVYHCSIRNFCIDNPQIDGRGPDEFALIDFGDLVVQITSATFAAWDWNDTFAYGVYTSTDWGTSAATYVEDVAAGVTNNPYTHLYNAGDVIGSIIGFGADSGQDNILLQSITFDIIAAVPLPAGGLLILTALGGLVIMRRRKEGAAVAA